MNLMEPVDLFGNTYRGRTVLITGHSGFGGVWLTAWLVLLGANVVGYSDQLVSDKNRFKLLELVGYIKEIRGDVRHKVKLEQAIQESQPDIVFHLAAQSLVIPSYLDPFMTFETNVLGTLNLLEIIRNTQLPIAAVFITSDKVYNNEENRRSYVENDNLGGFDPYSASKAMSEFAVNSYLQSSSETGFSVNTLCISSARSGNWIGGGDFSEYRLIPDLAKALGEKREAILRSPDSIRPWQYVLDPLKGFLMLGSKLLSNESKFSGPWNFGPSNLKPHTCEELFRLYINEWGSGSYRIEPSDTSYHETKILTLNSQKANENLRWRPTYSTKDAIKHTADWYKRYFDLYFNTNIKTDLTSLYFEQINRYAINPRNVSK